MIIGHIYRRLCGGGMPRGAESIFPVQYALGHKLIVFTYEQGDAKDFAISVPHRRIVIGRVGVHETSSPERTARLRKAIIDAGCDLVIHHVYYYKSTIDDLRLFKEMGIPALVHWHICFSGLIWEEEWDGHVLEQIESVAKCARCMITLSRMDKAFFELMGVPAVHIPYSDPDLFESVPVHGDGHHLIWTGRMVSSKRPLHAVQILERVLERFPDATLTMLGDGVLRKEIEEYVASRPELSGHVSLPGFINDVAHYLREADLFLVTTEFEGFMHSLMEAKMAALPIVGYRMDYLDTTRPNTGYCAVPQGNVAAAAEEVCRLLADSDERHRLGAMARKDFEWFLNIDQKSLYSKAFDIACHPQNYHLEKPPAFVPEMIRILFEHMDANFRDRKAKIDMMVEKIRLCERQCSG